MRRLSTMILGTALAACGDPNPKSGTECTVDGGAAPPKNLFPLTANATWSYEVTDISGSSPIPLGSKTQTVTGTTSRDGVDGDVFVLETARPDGQLTTSFQQDIGAAVVRYAEDYSSGVTFLGQEVYDPCKLRMPKTLYSVGATLSHSFREEAYDAAGGLLSVLDKTETFGVEASGALTLPAGTFNDVVQVHRTTSPTGADKLFWYVEGVGKVREEGGGQIEELSCFRIPAGMESCGLCDASCLPL